MDATCLGGEQVTGGGFFLNGDLDEVVIVVNHPSDFVTWRVVAWATANYDGIDLWQLEAYAICATVVSSG
jgi:hypothetical protein